MREGNRRFSWSEIPYGISDLKENAASRYFTRSSDPLLHGERLQCCINGCEERLERRHRGQRPSYCPKHGISMSTKPTYVYKDAKRNFIVGRDILRQVSKVESWRLGFETSEDAVSWNVFVGLYVLEGLADAFEKLTGETAKGDPELYLWGNRVDVELGWWTRLTEVRAEIEKDLAIPTEPDIILRVPGQAIVLIEAKFGSPNGTMAGKRGRFGSVTKFLDRYTCEDGAIDPLNRKWIFEQQDEGILEQLCRNAIFAQRLASGCEKPFVINLVRRAAQNDEQLFRQHLSGNAVHFHVRTWEDLYRLPVIQTEPALLLCRYFENKTLNLWPAFAFE